MSSKWKFTWDPLALWIAICIIAILMGIWITIGANAEFEKSCQYRAEQLGLEYQVDGRYCLVSTPDLGWWEIETYKDILAIRQMDSLSK